MTQAPSTYKGKRLCFAETVRSGVVRPTKESALQDLENWRSNYSENYGWIELDYRIEKVSRGYVAVRHHAQYK